jgi:hypothetical protein
METSLTHQEYQEKLSSVAPSERVTHADYASRGITAFSDKGNPDIVYILSECA